MNLENIYLNSVHGIIIVDTITRFASFCIQRGVTPSTRARKSDCVQRGYPFLNINL